jgi:hypothetical protein
MRFAFFVAFLAVLFSVIGYIMNLAALVSATATTTLVEVAIRIVGIFAFPVGVLAGWFL